MRRTIRFQTLLISVVLILAAVSRFASLNSWPLTEYEARHALSALDHASLQRGFWIEGVDHSTPSPLYYLLTNLTFGAFGASEFTARLIPALAGFLLLIVILGRKGENPPGFKLIWLGLIATSAVLISSSRTASGDILAALCVTYVLLNLNRQSPEFPLTIDVLVVSGVGLTTGNAVFKAITGIALAFFLDRILTRDRGRRLFGDWFTGAFLKLSWIAPLTALLVLTGFGTSFVGMRGFATSLGDWMMGWSQPSGYSFLELMVILITSEPLIVLFGIIGVIRYWRSDDHSVRYAGVWAAGAGISLLIYPGRAPFDLIWIILPLAYPASQAILELIGEIGGTRSRAEIIGLLCLLITFVASGALSFVAYGTGNVVTVDPSNPNLVLFLFVALAVMGVSVLVFFGVGWSWKIVLHAAGLLLLLLGFMQGISTTWRLNYNVEGPQVSDLWWQTVPTRGLSILVETLERTAMAHTGQVDQLQIAVKAEPSASIAWALRAFQKSGREAAFGLEAAPAILMRERGGDAELPADYVGQSLGLRVKRGWNSILPPNWIRWWVKGEVPTELETWVLWVRADVASFGEIGLEE